MRRFIFYLLFFIVTGTANSQVLKGTIHDTEGEPIPYATVYITELKQGTTANTKGDFEIKLPQGTYTVTFESLGFSPDIRTIKIGNGTITLSIVLQVQTYEIPEVRITASGEDPAYGIMRKVIGTAPYYLNQVSHYVADVYLKGNLVLNKIPKLIQNRIKAEARNSSTNNSTNIVMKEGETYMMESFNEIEFNAPDRYKQRVISSQSTFPEQGQSISPMDFIQASFYEPIIANMFISPLSPEAFFHYKFKYLGLSSQGGYYVDKIEVTPKRKSQQLFKGTIYIIEDLWCLHSVELENENIAGKVRITQLYIPVQENVWLPVSHKFDINISIIGVKGDAGYGSSIKYRDVAVNQSLKRPEALADYKSHSATEQKDTVKSKTTKQIEAILSKEELSNRDMVKLQGLLNKQSKESLPDSVKNNLEVKDRTTYIIEKDADKKDSSYWAGIRPIPLSENEFRSIKAADSVKARLAPATQKTDSASKKTTSKATFFPFLGRIAFGHTWTDTTGFFFRNSGLFNLRNFSFNTVDGFTYGFDLRFSKTWNKKYTLGVSPSFKYGFGREKFMWRVNSQFTYGRKHQTMISLRAGSISTDLNGSNGINPLINTVTTLLLESNYLKLYQQDFIMTGIRKELSNGLYASLQGMYEKRTILENTTDFTLIKTSRTYTDNIPVNSILQNPSDPLYTLRNHTNTAFLLSVQYTPLQKYTIRNGTKFSRGSEYPTFSLSWKHGINDFGSYSPRLYHSDAIRFEAWQNINLGAMSEFRWRYRAGGYLKKTGITFIDFFHFNEQPLLVLLNNYEDAFMLPKFYSLSTPEIYSEFHTKYTTPYLLLKLLPGLSNSLMRENVSLSFLWSRYRYAYTEIGYSISEFLFVGELGVYAGFDNFSFRSVGAKITFRFD